MYCISSGLFGDPSRVLQSYSRSSFHWCCRDSTTATRPLRSTWSRVEQTPVSPECCCTTYLRGEQVRSCNTASTRSTVVARARAYRIDFKIAVLIYRCLHGLAPAYLSTELESVKDMPSRQRLRSWSSDTLAVATSRLSTVGDRAFPVIAAVWNALRVDVISSTTPPAFKRLLKTELFSRSFPDA